MHLRLHPTKTLPKKSRPKIKSLSLCHGSLGSHEYDCAFATLRGLGRLTDNTAHYMSSLFPRGIDDQQVATLLERTYGIPYHIHTVSFVPNAYAANNRSMASISARLCKNQSEYASIKMITMNREMGHAYIIYKTQLGELYVRDAQKGGIFPFVIYLYNFISLTRRPILEIVISIIYPEHLSRAGIEAGPLITRQMIDTVMTRRETRNYEVQHPSVPVESGSVYCESQRGKIKALIDGADDPEKGIFGLNDKQVFEDSRYVPLNYNGTGKSHCVVSTSHVFRMRPSLKRSVKNNNLVPKTKRTGISKRSRLNTIHE